MDDFIMIIQKTIDTDWNEVGTKSSHYYNNKK
jgi:hypothetical protein